VLNINPGMINARLRASDLLVTLGSTLRARPSLSTKNQERNQEQEDGGWLGY
jgi:hypothetical protein